MDQILEALDYIDDQQLLSILDTEEEISIFNNSEKYNSDKKSGDWPIKVYEACDYDCINKMFKLSSTKGGLW